MKKERFFLTVLITVLTILLFGDGVFTAEDKATHTRNHSAKHHEYIHHEGHHRFEDAEAWAKLFEGPKRDAWQKPDTLIKTLNLKQDMIIADIGSATGYFPVRFAKAVPNGKVYGIDIEKTMVDYLNERARRENLPNLLSILAQPEDPKLPEPVDLVFICNTYHHIGDREIYFEKLKKYLLPGAQLVIVDFKKGDLPIGPPDHMKLSPEEVISELCGTDYNLVQNHTFLPYQYVLLFQPG
jgi:cyclopropane fatty-acyl-phospholipid synthase-like methyltransferase